MYVTLTAWGRRGSLFRDGVGRMILKAETQKESRVLQMLSGCDLTSLTRLRHAIRKKLSDDELKTLAAILERSLDDFERYLENGPDLNTDA